jgi:putative ABC transport system permease protein
LPYKDGGDLVLIRQHRPLLGIQNQAFSVKEIQDYRDQVRGLGGLVEFHAMSFVLLGREEPSRVQTGVVSHNFFDVPGVKPLLGRSFQESDESNAAEAVLLLRYTYWQNEFGGDPAVVGKTFQMNDRPHTVIGVLPQIPQYPIENDVYMPTSACPFRSNPQFIDNRNSRMMQVFARKTAGMPLERIQNDISATASRLAQDFIRPRTRKAPVTKPSPSLWKKN